MRRLSHRLLRPIRRFNDHRRTDVYVVSFPKAGRTWLRVMLGKALTETYGLSEDLLLDTYVLTRRAGVLRTRLTHDGSSIVERRSFRKLSNSKRRYRNKKVVLLVRDVRDILVSCYFQATRRVGVFEGTISEFIRDERYGVRKIVTFYNAWFENRHVPREFLVLNYEDMHSDSHKVLAEILAFLEARDVTEQAMRNAIEFSRFGRMRAMERGSRWARAVMRPGHELDEESFKVRRGVVGGHRDYLSQEDIQYMDEVIQELGWFFGVDGPQFRLPERARSRHRIHE
jgi:hypothetical protein